MNPISVILALFLFGIVTTLPLQGGNDQEEDWNVLSKVEELKEIRIPVRWEVKGRVDLEDELDKEEAGLDEEIIHSRSKRSKSDEKRRNKKKSRKVPDLGGDVVFSARRAFRLYFDFDYSALSESDVVSAQVLLYHARSKRGSRSRKARSADVMSGSGTRLNKSARVIMHQTIEYGTDFGTTRATDIKLVQGRNRGWLNFDITPALKDWIADPSSNQGLEIWVVSSTPGRQAARIASRMRFVKPSSERAHYRPELVVKLQQPKDVAA